MKIPESSQTERTGIIEFPKSFSGFMVVCVSEAINPRFPTPIKASGRTFRTQTRQAVIVHFKKKKRKKSWVFLGPPFLRLLFFVVVSFCCNISKAVVVTFPTSWLSLPSLWYRFYSHGLCRPRKEEGEGGKGVTFRSGAGFGLPFDLLCSTSSGTRSVMVTV